MWEERETEKSDTKEKEFKQVRRWKESSSCFCMDLLFVTQNALMSFKIEEIQCTKPDGQVCS